MIRHITITLLFIIISNKANSQKVGDTIYGDFNGDKKIEYAYRFLAKNGNGNSVENGIPNQYEIRFSDKTIKNIKVNCCWFKLINEGDLDNDGNDEITIVQSPENGCLGTVSTYTLKKDSSSLLFKPFSMFICAELTDTELQKLIIKENNIVYFYEADPNDENLLNEDGDKIIFGRLKKTVAYKIIPTGIKKHK
jgi:hypothetical protein